MSRPCAAAATLVGGRSAALGNKYLGYKSGQQHKGHCQPADGTACLYGCALVCVHDSMVPRAQQQYK